MTTFSTPKPVQPTPDQFGLTEQRIRQFEPTRRTVIIAIPLCVIGAIGIAIRDPIALFTALPIWAIIVYWSVRGIESIWNAIWRARQPDYPKLKEFEEATRQYHEKLQQWHRAQVEWWQSLDGFYFEVELVRLFEKRGYKARRLGGAGDGGVDIVLQKDGKEILVQCKAHARQIGPGAVRDLYGTMMHKNAAEAWLISTRGFSNTAKAFAMGKPLKLIRIDDVLNDRYL